MSQLSIKSGIQEYKYVGVAGRSSAPHCQIVRNESTNEISPIRKGTDRAERYRVVEMTFSKAAIRENGRVSKVNMD